VAERDGVLEDVDLHILTFSKSCSGVGGALVAKKKITNYVNGYARCRVFSCALDPEVTGGMLKVLELAEGPAGDVRRKRIVENAGYLKNLLHGKVDLGISESWVVTVIYHTEKITLDLYDFILRNGLDGSIMEFPAVPKNQARIRLFVTSEHTREELEKAADILLSAARHFGF
jgi:glycine C-acetyltransferase